MTLPTARRRWARRSTCGRHYFFGMKLPNIDMPQRRYFTTNDPVMTPALLDHFFNKRTSGFAGLDDRKKALLWSIYNAAEYRSVLPMLDGQELPRHPLRQHQRYSMRAPAEFVLQENGEERVFVLQIIEISLKGFQAESKLELPVGRRGSVRVQLGRFEHSRCDAEVMRTKSGDQAFFVGFRIDEADAVWRRCVGSFESGMTAHDLLQ